MEKRKRIQIYPCIVEGCPGKDSDEIALYAIPDRDIGAWCLNLQINPLTVKTTTRVCSRHFEKEWQGVVKLKAGARPTLHLGGRRNITALPYDATKPRFNPRKCAIKGCNVTSPPERLHKFPKDTERYEQWISVCPIKVSALENKHKYICEKHFHPADIEECRLKKDAVPLANLCYNLLDNPPCLRKPRRRKRKRQTAGESITSFSDNFERDDDTQSNFHEISDYESNGSTDGLECQCCNVCQDNCEQYQKKYLEAEKQLKEAEARHLIETLALQNQIEELTVELEKAQKGLII